MTGIRELPSGRLQAFVKVQGKFYSDTFDPDTPLRELREWREDKRVEVRTGVKLPTVDKDEPTFREDVARYLKLRTSMPTFGTRARHLTEWAAYFGRRTRGSITPLMIQQRLEAIVKDGASPATANRHRTALQSLWTVLDGKSARNPVRDVPKYREPAGEPRALSYLTIYRILVCMRPSKTRSRLRVLAWTGWPHTQIGALKEEHLKLDPKTLTGRAYVTPRRKGKGTHGVWLPLVPGAVKALAEFHKDDAYGTFSTSSMRHAFLLGLAKVNAHRAKLKLKPIVARPYDLRHSFGTWLAFQTHDERVVQTLMLHGTAEQSRRYTEAATTPRVDAAIRGLQVQPFARSGPSQAVSHKVRKARKSLKRSGAPGRI